MCPKCKTELQLLHVQENHIFHCTQKYYKIVKGQKRQTITFAILNLMHFMKRDLNKHVWTLQKYVVSLFVIMPPPQQRFLKNELKINDNCVVDCTNFCREVNIVIINYI